MDRKRRGFEDKFLSKIGKIDRHHLRDYILQLLSQKNFFETVFDHLSEGIFVTDSTLRILYSNPVARLMLQWAPRKYFIGERLTEHCPPGELQDIFLSMGRHPRRIEQYDCTIGQDSARKITLTAISVEAAEMGGLDEGKLPGTMWVFLLRDVTERYRSIEEHSRAQRLASLALLTSGVAHEIKNPLNSLNIHAQILLKTAEAEGEGELDRKKVRRAAEVILEETARLTEIVNEFIQATRPQRPVMDRQPLTRVLEDLKRIFGPECEQAGISFKVDADSDLPQIDMDAHLIFQALRNLVRNAIEAHLQAAVNAGESPEPEHPMLIAVRARSAGDSVKIEVADNGPGIAEETIDRIFEPYYTTKFNGTGLGLMIVYRIVAEHEGSINVESKVGFGTRFTISLPVAERPVRLLDKPAETVVQNAN